MVSHALILTVIYALALVASTTLQRAPRRESVTGCVTRLVGLNPCGDSRQPKHVQRAHGEVKGEGKGEGERTGSAEL